MADGVADHGSGTTYLVLGCLVHFAWGGEIDYPVVIYDVATKVIVRIAVTVDDALRIGSVRHPAKFPQE